MILTEEQRQLRWQMEIVAHSGVHAIEYFNAVTDKGHGQFWSFTQNCLGERACHLWCQLFNSYNKEPTHYRNLFGDDALKSLDTSFGTDAVRNRLIAATGMKEREYNEFRDTVINFRNQYAAHREFERGSITFPVLDDALCVFYELREILHETVTVELKNIDDIELEDLLRYFETNTGQDIKNMCKNEISRINFY